MIFRGFEDVGFLEIVDLCVCVVCVCVCGGGGDFWVR